MVRPKHGGQTLNVIYPSQKGKPIHAFCGEAMSLGCNLPTSVHVVLKWIPSINVKKVPVVFCDTHPGRLESLGQLHRNMVKSPK